MNRSLKATLAASFLLCACASDDGARASTRSAIVGDAPSDVRCPFDPSLPQRTDFAKAGPFTAATLDITFEDKSRPVLASATHERAPARRLVTTIYYPAAGPAPLLGVAPLATGQRFPLLMYSHGYSSSRGEASRVANRLASYGYIVVAPDFPFTNLQAEGGPDIEDAANQPGDISFLIDRLLSFSNDPSHFLWGAVDEERIGALGVSLGGLTTLLVSFHPRFQDARVKVAMPIAPASDLFAEGFYHTRELPVLLVAGDLDAILDYQRNARRSFEFAGSNAMLITIAKGTHAAFGFDFPAGVIPLINTLIAPPGADPSNPDGLGCGAVGAKLAAYGPAWIDALGDAGDFIDAKASTLDRACKGDEYKRAAIDAQEQEDIVLRSAVPYFNAHFGRSPAIRQDGCRYLSYELPKRPGVTVE